MNKTCSQTRGSQRSQESYDVNIITKNTKIRIRVGKLHTQSHIRNEILGRVREIDELELVKTYKTNSIQINNNPIEEL